MGTISTDPIGFDAGDANLYRYVGNHGTYTSDPSGNQEPGPDPNKFEPIVVKPISAEDLQGLLAAEADLLNAQTDRLAGALLQMKLEAAVDYYGIGNSTLEDQVNAIELFGFPVVHPSVGKGNTNTTFVGAPEPENFMQSLARGKSLVSDPRDPGSANGGIVHWVLGNLYHRSGVGPLFESGIRSSVQPFGAFDEAANIFTGTVQIPFVWNDLPDEQKQDIAVNMIAGAAFGTLLTPKPTLLPQPPSGLGSFTNASSRASHNWGVNWFRTSELRSIMGGTDEGLAVLRAADEGTIDLSFYAGRGVPELTFGEAIGGIGGSPPEAIVYLANTQNGRVFNSLGGRRVSGYQHSAATAVHEGLHALGIRGSARAEALVRLSELRTHGATITRSAIREVLQDMRDAGRYGQRIVRPDGSLGRTIWKDRWSQGIGNVDLKVVY